MGHVAGSLSVRPRDPTAGERWCARLHRQLRPQCGWLGQAVFPPELCLLLWPRASEMQPPQVRGGVYTGARSERNGSRRSGRCSAREFTPIGLAGRGRWFYLGCGKQSPSPFVPLFTLQCWPASVTWSSEPTPTHTCDWRNRLGCHLCPSHTTQLNSGVLVFAFKEKTQQIIFLDLQYSNCLKGRFHQSS